jgi:NADP-dependent 3-hydroxy acid dehydrogenase YdfG
MENLAKQQNTSLNGKKVLILGGSAGIGLATAKATANEGAEIIIVSSNQQRINNALKELPVGSKGYAVDLSNEQATQDFFAELGKFDHLVYCRRKYTAQSYYCHGYSRCKTIFKRTLLGSVYGCKICFAKY